MMKNGADDGAKEQGVPQSLVLEHVSPATRLLEKRRQMFEVQEALDAQKEEFSRREEAFHRREEGLRKKDLELQESLIKFNKFLQENESKRNRAEKRAQEEAKQRRQKEADITKLKQEFKAMKDECSKLEETVGSNLKYQRFLEKVQEEVPEDYPEVSDLLNRYKTLKDANIDLTNRLQMHEDLNESKRADFVHYTKEQTNDILNFNNKIAFMQKAMETSESTAFRLQNEVDGQIRSISDRTLEIGQALMAIENLLQRCTSKKHGNYLKHFQASEDQHFKNIDELNKKGKSAMSQLDVIASYIVDFKSISEETQFHKTAIQPPPQKIDADAANHESKTNQNPPRNARGSISIPNNGGPGSSNVLVASGASLVGSSSSNGVTTSKGNKK